MIALTITSGSALTSCMMTNTALVTLCIFLSLGLVTLAAMVVLLSTNPEGGANARRWLARLRERYRNDAAV